MYCRQCGSRIHEGAAFCGTCGAAVALAPGDTTLAAAQTGPGGGPFTGGRVDWTLQDVLFGVLFFLGLFIVAPLPFVLPFLAFGEDSSQFLGAALITGAGSEAGLIVVAAWFTFRKYGGSWERLGFRRPSWSTLGYAVAAVVAALVLANLYDAIIRVFDIDVLRSERDDQLPNEVLDRNLLLAISGIVVIGFAPVCEETFFRGFILPGMARAWGIGIAISASALTFSAAHVGPNMHKTIVPILIIGAVLGFTYYRSQNLLASIGAHLIFNTLAFILLAMSEPETVAGLRVFVVGLVYP